MNGIVTAGIQTIEKEFGLTSAQSGFIVAGNDVSALILVAFISFWGTKGHKPKWIGYGAILTGKIMTLVERKSNSVVDFLHGNV